MTLEAILFFMNACVLLFFLCLGISHTALLILAFPDIWRRFSDSKYGNMAKLINQAQLVPITIITPAHNEENRILNSVLSILNSDYKNVQIIISSDGSVDNTIPLLIEKFALYPVPVASKQQFPTARVRNSYVSDQYPITVLDKEQYGGADAINAAINICKTPLFLTFDADTILEPEALTQMVLTYLSDQNYVSVGGSIYVLNENEVVNGKIINPKIPRSYVPAVQTPEYLRSFLFGRDGWNKLGGSLSYPGAFTLFETKAVRAVGGFDRNNTSYDYEIILRLQERGRRQKPIQKVCFAPTAFSWTEVPATWKKYWRQRNLWHRGIMRATMSYKRMFFNPRYGMIGFFTYPFYLFFETFGCLVETAAYIILLLSLFIIPYREFLPFTILFVALAWLFLAFLTIAMACLDVVTFNKYRKLNDIWHFFYLCILEFIAFRQFGVICKTVAIFHYYLNRMRGKDQ